MSESKQGSRKALKNNISCYKFSQDKFRDVVRDVCGIPPSETYTPIQVAYLGKYLEAQLGASTLVVESHYIDRNFMEEFSIFYSKCLSPTPNFCTRIHVFSQAFTAGQLTADLVSAGNNQLDDISKKYQTQYCGFIVVRPLPSVPIGRTVLCPPRGDDNRSFLTCRTYRVHLFGLELTVNGLAFQQQDQAVAACATTAVWSALQKVCSNDGSRSPTSSAITEAAVRHYLPEGRPFPSKGLTIEQIGEALRSFEFAPDLFRVGPDFERFKFLINVYLLSGIPVVLAIYPMDAESGHAVTIVGYHKSDILQSEIKLKNPDRSLILEFSNIAFDAIYIHDDRLGPYARAEILTKEIIDKNGTSYGEKLCLVIEWPDGSTETSLVSWAAAPLYSKLRSSALELLDGAFSLYPVIVANFYTPNEVPRIAMFFEHSGTYQASLYSLPCNPNTIASLQQEFVLSRYVGVVRWFKGNAPLLDVVYDTTDSIRVTRNCEHLLGVVSFSRDGEEKIIELGNALGTLCG